jgi:hypothetical protein
MPFDTEVGFWVAQGIGFVAALLGVVSFQLARDRSMFLTLAASAMVWAVHFLLLGAPAAAAINAVTALRNLSGAFLRRRWLGYGFAAFYIAAAGGSLQSGWDLLPLVAVLSGTAATFFLTGLRVRLALLAGSVLWVIFSVVAGSIPGVVMMAADAVSNLRFILRARRGGPTA